MKKRTLVDILDPGRDSIRFGLPFECLGKGKREYRTDRRRTRKLRNRMATTCERTLIQIRELYVYAYRFLSDETRVLGQNDSIRNMKICIYHRFLLFVEIVASKQHVSKVK